MVAYYGALLGFLTVGRRRLARVAVLGLPGRVRHVRYQLLTPLPLRRWMLLPTALIAALLWLAVLSGPDGRLHLTVLDVGAGNALLLETPGGLPGAQGRDSIGICRC